MLEDHLRRAITAGRLRDATDWRWGRLTVRVRAEPAHLTVLHSMLPAASWSPVEVSAELIVVEDALLAANILAACRDEVSVDGATAVFGSTIELAFASLDVRAWPRAMVLGRTADGPWWCVVPPGPLAVRAAEIALKQILEDDLAGRAAVPLHASSVVPPGGSEALLFLGSAGAGKTTSAVTLARGGGSYLSGDRTSLVMGSSGVVAVGGAQSTRLRWGTIDGLGLREAILASPPIRHGIDHRALTEPLPEKVVLGHGELAGLGLSTVADAPAAAVVVLEPRDSSERPGVRAADASPAELAVPHLRRSWLAVPPIKPVPAPDLGLLDRVPWYRLRWLPAEDDLSELVQSIPEARS